MICNYIEKKYPNAILEAVIDRKTGILFHGKRSISKEWLINNNETICFVCAPAAMVESYEYFKEINQKKYLMCWADGLTR